MLETSEQICEALVRHTEISGYEIFEKNFVKDGKIICSVWCAIGEHADDFHQMVTAWLKEHGFDNE